MSPTSDMLWGKNTLGAWLLLNFPITFKEPLLKKASRNMNSFMLSKLISNAGFCCVSSCGLQVANAHP